MNNSKQNKLIKTTRYVVNYLKSILFTMLILFLSFTPPSSFKKLPEFNVIPHFDKLVHYILYAILTLIIIWESKNDEKLKQKSRNQFIICFLFPIVLGGVVEIMQQYFFPPRTAELIDWSADIAGVITAWILILALKKLKLYYYEQR